MMKTTHYQKLTKGFCFISLITLLKFTDVSLGNTTLSEDNIHMLMHSLLTHLLWADNTYSVHGRQIPFIFMGGKRGDICFIQLKGFGIVDNFHYSWDFCVEPKVIILIISDCLFSPNRSLQSPSVCSSWYNLS